MKSFTILYVIGLNTITTNNGIKRQAEIWRDGLVARGYNIIYFNPWDTPDWNNIDLIHVFGNGLWLIETISSLDSLNIPIIVSPIIDSYKPVWIYKIASKFGVPKFRLFTSNYALRFLKQKIAHVLVRSQHEYSYLHYAYGFIKDDISVLRLPSRISEMNQPINPDIKKNFCLHVSTFSQPRKNVMRLMKAAVKYNFELIIAGAPGPRAETEPFYQFAANHHNIKILGAVSDSELVELYRQAKVFALPSIEEGVGFVALEAATMGCNIVITNIGGPKEYYNTAAIEVDPFNIDAIGKAVIKAMNTATTTNLANHIKLNYSLDKNISNLIQIYERVLRGADFKRDC